jgi:putative transposase
MAWKIRQRGEDLYHHIYAWGNDRHPVFKHLNHYRKYLSLLNGHAKTYDISVIAYALMEWHVHLFIYDQQNSISEFMMDLHGDYAQYYNRVTKRVGHVFGERFNNKIVKCNIYGKWLTKYIHRQAVEAGLIRDPQDYPWSSYRVYLGREKSALVKPDIILDQFGQSSERSINYKSFVEGGDDGPVDWSMRYFRLRSISDFIRVACAELKIEPDIVMKPRGREEQMLRSRVVQRLVKRHDIKAINIAKGFGLSRSAVAQILKRGVK